MYHKSIEITRILSPTERQVYRYAFIEGSLILETYSRQTRTTPRHKFQVEDSYSRLEKRSASIKDPAQIPNLPSEEEVKTAFLAEFTAELNVRFEVYDSPDYTEVQRKQK